MLYVLMVARNIPNDFFGLIRVSYALSCSKLDNIHTPYLITYNKAGDSGSWFDAIGAMLSGWFLLQFLIWLGALDASGTRLTYDGA